MDHHVALELVHHRLDVHIVREVEETASLEIAHADGADLAVPVGLLHRPPGAEHVAVGLVDQKQVDVVGLQLPEALVDGGGSLFLAVVADPDLRHKEYLLAGNAGLCDGIAHAFLVEVGLGRIDETVTDRQRVVLIALPEP